MSIATHRSVVVKTLNVISSHSPLTAQSESSCSSRSISPDETRRYFRTQRFPARPPTPSVFQLPDDDDPLLRRDPHRWNRTFGGDCDVTFENKQQHDRHVLSHIPDARGVLWTTYKCRFCLEKRAEVLQKAAESGRIDKRDVGLFARKDPCDRHLRTIHSAENVDNEVAYIIEDATPWWWPSALSYTSTYNKPAENLEPRPDGENRTWREYLDDILDERPFARDKPLEPIEGLKMDIGLTDGGETTSRPANRRRSSK
ncbi:hypothetical protein A7U60_g7514 [Sanghuangporus baumii]|uniref:Uncharacterized protein n=1 Tax=Sanghuangporus baumii TaxID=108892 RepID=A0A9Q5N9K7_SANBA|nr:hypothetical protein A7U60_g7514 [Sanghuangporus baumii]